MNSAMLLCALCCICAVISGCAPSTPLPNPRNTTVLDGEHQHADQQTGGHNEHQSPPVKVVFHDLPTMLNAGRSKEVTFHLESNGRRVGNLVPIHEKLMHFILVSDALDEFLHLHPQVQPDGEGRVELSIPQPGLYHVFIDFQSAGQEPGTAHTTLTIAGDERPPAALTVNSPGRVQVENLDVKIDVIAEKSERTVRIEFQLFDRFSGELVNNLEPYLGAMGHLVVIEAGSKAYVHAHPTPNEGVASNVSFSAHLPSSGRYAAWVQFQRGGKILTVPFAFDAP